MKTNINSFWTNVRKSLSWEGLQGVHYRIAAIWLALFLLSWFLSPYLAVVVAVALTIAADLMRARYMRSLTARIETKDPFAWNLEVNQVKVGTLSDADYALIQRRVYSDVRVYVTQALNLLRVSLNLLGYYYRAIPLGVFWIGVALLLFSPETLTSVLSELQNVTAGDMRNAVQTTVSVLAILMMLSITLCWTLGVSRFGFVDRFDEAIGTAIRKHCGVAVNGSIVLMRSFHVSGSYWRIKLMKWAAPDGVKVVEK